MTSWQLAFEAAAKSPRTIRSHLDSVNLRVFFGWLASEDERSNPNPMTRAEGPKVTKKAKPFFDDEELARLLKTCQSSSFADRRDRAIPRMLIDTGLRVSGVANLRYDQDDETRSDVFLTQRRLSEPHAYWLRAAGPVIDAPG